MKFNKTSIVHNNNNNNTTIIDFSQLPQPILQKILLYVHQGIFPSEGFIGCSKVCKQWQSISQKILKRLVFHGSDIGTVNRLLRASLLSPDYNSCLEEISIHSIADLESCNRVLTCLTTPFFSKITSSFYQPPIHSLEIVSTDLKDRDIELVATIIVTFNIRSLCLRGVSLNDHSLVVIAKALSENHFNCLQHLDLSHNCFSRRGLEFLLNKLIETHKNNHLDYLVHDKPYFHSTHFNSNNSFSVATNYGSGESSTLGSIASLESIPQQHQPTTESSSSPSSTPDKYKKAYKLHHKPKEKFSLLTLNLCNNSKLNIECIQVIKESLVHLDHIRELNLGSVSLCNDGLNTIIQFLQATPSIKNINLSNNGIYTKGAESISCLIQSGTLQSLDISENKLSLNGIRAITTAASTPSSKLTELYLRRTQISFDESLLLRNLILQSRSLTKLDFSSNMLNEESVAVISEALSTNQSVVDLNLSFNVLGPTGCFHLAKSIRTNTKLKILRLHCISMKKEGTQSLTEALAVNHSITQLLASNNFIKNSGCLYFAKLFKQNQTLTFCDLSCNGITDKGASELFKSINDISSSTNSPIKLDLNGNLIKNLNKNNKEACILM
eukprot:gene6121-7627_t